MFDLSINYSVIVMTMFSVLTITNPITTIPYYFMLHPKSTHKETKKDGRRIALVVFLILVSAFLVGGFILGFLGLKIPYFNMGGGVVLLLMALSMIKGEMSSINITKSEQNKMRSEYIEKGLVIPLALPLTSGPGSIAFVISLQGIGMLNGVLAILGSSIITMLILMYSSVIRKALGEIGMHLITRVFGLFMIGSALQIIGENIMYIVKNYH